MDLEQLTQRLEYLENERRKDKMLIATLEERLATLEETVPGVKGEINDLTTDVARQKASLARFEQVEASIVQIRVDLTRAIEAVDRQRVDHDRDVEKTRLAEMETVQKNIAEIRRGLEPLPEIRRSVQARMEEEFRLARLIEEVNKKITDYRRSDDEYRRALKVLEESQRQDAKRLSDMQGEVVAFRKRLEEQRGKNDIASDLIRKLEVRLNDLQSAEGERRQSVSAFMDQQRLINVERDRLWKEWQARFETVERQSINLDTQLQTLDATHRAVRRSQETLDEVAERFERRITEITELQRLIEDRFRQEWVSFKADDQKRWTNYTLAQEEQVKEVSRGYSRMDERLVQLEDTYQDVQDLLHQTVEETQKRLQGLLALSRSWLEAYEQVNNQAR